MDECSEASVVQLLPLVSPQRREMAMRKTSLQSRFVSLLSFRLLTLLLPQLHWDDVVWHYNAHGKPFLVGRDGHHVGYWFSISHCRKAVLVAAADCEVGADVESFRTPSPALLRRCMNADEMAQICSDAHPDQVFTLLWTRKEAVAKYRGTGIDDTLPDLLSGPEQVESRLFPGKGYACSVAMAQPQPIESVDFDNIFPWS